MKKVLLVTIFTVPNYGSVLQTYATQFVLECLGLKCSVLNYDHNKSDWAKAHGVKSMSLKSKIALWFGLKAFYRRAKMLKSFTIKNLKLTKSYSNIDDIRLSEGSKHDIYIAGSDQIWNTRFTNCDPVFLLDFVEGQKKKVSIASSFASNKVDDRFYDIFYRNLSTFSSLSVRESQGIEILSNMGLANSQLVLDPTLLLNSNQWNLLRNTTTNTSQNKKKYILLYLLRYAFDPCPYIYNVLSYYKEKLQCEIIALEGFDSNDMHAKELQIKDATESSIPEFLSYFANASLVVTSSFHGTAFALNYGVPLLSIVPNGGDDRQSSLLKQVGLEQCKLHVNEDISHANPFYDKDSEQEKLEDLRKESLNWIKKAVLN